VFQTAQPKAAEKCRIAETQPLASCKIRGALKVPRIFFKQRHGAAAPNPAFFFSQKKKQKMVQGGNGTISAIFPFICWETECISLCATRNHALRTKSRPSPYGVSVKKKLISTEEMQTLSYRFF
jgi:hypothetical protein